MSSATVPQIVKPQYIPLRNGDFAPRYLGRIADDAIVLYLFIPFKQVFAQTAVAFSHRLSNSVRGSIVDEALHLWSLIAEDIKSYPAPRDKVGVRIGGAGGQIFDRVMADVTIVPRNDQDLSPHVELKDDNGNDLQQRQRLNRKEQKPKKVIKAGFLMRLIVHQGDEAWEDDDLTDLPPVAGEAGDEEAMDVGGDDGKRARLKLTDNQKRAVKVRLERRIKRNIIYIIENLMTPTGRERFKSMGHGKAAHNKSTRYWNTGTNRDGYLEFVRRQLLTDDIDFDVAKKEHLFDEDAQARPEKVFSFRHARGAMIASGAHPEFWDSDNWVVHKLPADGRFTVRIAPHMLAPHELSRYLFPDMDRPRLDKNSPEWKMTYEEVFNRLKSVRFEPGDDENDTEEQKQDRDREIAQDAEEQTRIELEAQAGTATEFSFTDTMTLKKKITDDIRDSQARAIASFKVPHREDYGDDYTYEQARQACREKMGEAVAWAREKAIKRGINDISIFVNIDAALSKPQLVCRNHMDATIAKKKHLSIPFVRKMKNLTTFGEFQVSAILGMETLDGNYASHTIGTMLFLSHLTVFLPDAMKCHVLLAGDAKVGKSNILQQVQAAGHKELFVSSQGGSDLAEKANNAVGQRDQITMVMEEAPTKMMGLEHNPGQRQDASKQQAQTEVASRLRAEITNPEASEWHRLVQNKETGEFEMKSVGGRIRKVFLLAMNILFSQIPDNMRSRLLCLVMTTPSREDATLSQRAMSFKRSETANILREGWNERMKRIQDVAWRIGLYLETGVLSIDNSATGYFVEEVARRAAIAGVPGITDIREHLRIDQLIRACVLIQVQLDVLDVVFKDNPKLNAILLEKDHDEAKFIETIRPLLRTRIEHAVFVLSGMVQIFEDPISWKVCDAIKRRFRTPFTQSAERQFQARKRTRSGAFKPDAKAGEPAPPPPDPEDAEFEFMLEEYNEMEAEKIRQDTNMAFDSIVEEESKERKNGDPAFRSGEGIREHFVSEEQKLLHEEDAIKLDGFTASYDQHASESRRSWMQCEKLAKDIYSFVESPKPTVDEITRCLINFTRLLLPVPGNRGRMLPALRFQDTTCIISHSVLANSRRNPLTSIIYEVLCQDDMPKGRFVTLLPSRYCPWIMRTLCNDKNMMNSSAERKLYERVRKNIETEHAGTDGRPVYVNPCYYEPVLFKILNNEVTSEDGKAERKSSVTDFDRDDWKARQLGSEALFNHAMPALPSSSGDEKNEASPPSRTAVMEAMDLLADGDSQPVMRMDGPAEDLFNAKNLTRTLRMTSSVLENTVYRSPTKKVFLKPSKHHKQALEATAKACQYQYPDMFASRQMLQFRSEHTARLNDKHLRRLYSMRRIRERDAKQAGLDFLMPSDDENEDAENKSPSDRDDSPSPDNDRKDRDRSNNNNNSMSRESKSSSGSGSSSSGSNSDWSTMSLGGTEHEVKRNTGTKRKAPEEPQPSSTTQQQQQLPDARVDKSIGFLDIFGETDIIRTEEEMERLATKKRKVVLADGKTTSSRAILHDKSNDNNNNSNSSKESSAPTPPAPRGDEKKKDKKKKKEKEEEKKKKPASDDSDDEDDEDYTAADAEIDEDLDGIVNDGDDDEEDGEPEMDDSAIKLQKQILKRYKKGKKILGGRVGSLVRDLPESFINVYTDDGIDDEEADGTEVIDLKSIPDATEEEWAEIDKEDEELSSDGEMMNTSKKELKRERALAKKLRKEEKKLIKEKRKKEKEKRRKEREEAAAMEDDVPSTPQ